MKGKVTLITGGATGIGLALISRLYKENTVISFDRKEEKVLSLIKRFDSKVRAIRVDINDHTSCFNALDVVLEEYGKIDVFISNAGAGNIINVRSAEPRALEVFLHEEMMTNYLTPALMCKHLIPALEKSSSPMIVLTTSGLAYTPIAQFVGYCASKAAAHSFAMSLRHQLKETNIRVVETLPPTVDTDFNKGIDAPKISADKYAVAFLKALEDGKQTIKVGQSGSLEKFSRLFPKLAFNVLNKS